MHMYQKYCLNPQSAQDRLFFFTFFYFSTYEMVDSKYSTNIYKSLKLSIGAVMKIQKC